jgi:hypothetical protein
VTEIEIESEDCSIVVESKACKEDSFHPIRRLPVTMVMWPTQNSTLTAPPVFSSSSGFGICCRSHDAVADYKCAEEDEHAYSESGDAFQSEISALQLSDGIRPPHGIRQVNHSSPGICVCFLRAVLIVLMAQSLV